MIAARSLLLYLISHPDLGLSFSRAITGNLTPVTFADSEFGHHALDDGRATSGYCIFIRSNLVAFAAKTQRGATKSSNDAEVAAVSLATSVTMKIRNYITDLGLEVAGPSPVLVDNESVY